MLAGALLLATLPLAAWTLLLAEGDRAVAGYAGCTVLLALAWALLGAPWVALVQLATGASTALLLRQGEDVTADRPSLPLRLGIAGLCAALVATILLVLPSTPAPATPTEAGRLDLLVALGILAVAALGFAKLRRDAA